VSQLSFLQICSLIWVVNLYGLQRAIQEVGAANVRTLEMAVLLSDLSDTLSDVSRYFGHQSNAQEIGSMMDHEVVGRHAKDQSQPFDVTLRDREALIILDRFGPEVEHAKQWVQPLVEALDLTSSIESRAVTSDRPLSAGDV